MVNFVGWMPVTIGIDVTAMTPFDAVSGVGLFLEVRPQGAFGTDLCRAARSANGSRVGSGDATGRDIGVRQVGLSCTARLNECRDQPGCRGCRD